MHALLGCYSERKLWQLRHGSLAPQTLSDVMADERRNWALCQKDIKVSTMPASVAAAALCCARDTMTDFVAPRFLCWHYRACT